MRSDSAIIMTFHLSPPAFHPSRSSPRICSPETNPPSTRVATSARFLLKSKSLKYVGTTRAVPKNEMSAIAGIANAVTKTAASKTIKPFLIIPPS